MTGLSRSGKNGATDEDGGRKIEWSMWVQSYLKTKA